MQLPEDQDFSCDLNEVVHDIEQQRYFNIQSNTSPTSTTEQEDHATCAKSLVFLRCSAVRWITFFIDPLQYISVQVHSYVDMFFYILDFLFQSFISFFIPAYAGSSGHAVQCATDVNLVCCSSINNNIKDNGLTGKTLKPA